MSKTLNWLPNESRYASRSSIESATVSPTSAPLTHPSRTISRQSWPDRGKTHFTDAEERLARVLADMLDELRDEVLVDVLDRIEAEAGRARLLDDPFAPAVQVVLNVAVRVVDVGEHEVLRNQRGRGRYRRTSKLPLAASAQWQKGWRTHLLAVNAEREALRCQQIGWTACTPCCRPERRQQAHESVRT